MSINSARIPTGGRPPIDGIPRERMSVTIPAKIVERIRDEAYKERRPVSQVVADYLMDAMDMHSVGLQYARQPHTGGA